jgi:protein TonB
VLIVSEDVPEARRNDTATYLAQRTQLGSGATLDPAEASSPRAAAELAASQGRTDGTRLMDEAGALLATADGRVLTTSAQMPEILYFAPPASLTETTEVPVHAEGASDRDKAGVEDDEEQRLRGPKRDELWITPDTREALVAPYLVAWRIKIEQLGTLNFPQAAWRAPGTRNPDVEVVILSDGTLESATIVRSSGSAKLDQAATDILKLASPFDPFPKELADKYRLLRFTYGWEFDGGEVQRGTVTAPADSQ